MHGVKKKTKKRDNSSPHETQPEDLFFLETTAAVPAISRRDADPASLSGTRVGVSVSGFGALVVHRMVALITHYAPVDFSITILPSLPSLSPIPSAIPSASSSNNADDANNSAARLLTTEQRVLLDTSIVLLGEEVTGTAAAEERDKTKEREEEEEEEEEEEHNDTTTPSTSTSTMKLKPKMEMKTTPRKTKHYKYHLGMEAQYVPFLSRVLRTMYRTTKQKLMGVVPPHHQRDRNANENETEKATHDQDAVSLVLFNITTCLLFIQPDSITLWSDRRRCLLRIIQQQQQQQQHQHQPQIWIKELQYLNLLMTHHSKAPSSWAHRKYVMRQILWDPPQQHYTNSLLPSRTTSSGIQQEHRMHQYVRILREEITVCAAVAEQYPKNYYAWTHRIYIWNDFITFTNRNYYSNNNNKQDEKDDDGNDDDNNNNNDSQLLCYRFLYKPMLELLVNELRMSLWTVWIPKHPSDHCAIHFGSYLFNHLLIILLDDTKNCYNHDSDNDNDDREDKEIWNVVVEAYERITTLLSISENRRYSSCSSNDSKNKTTKSSASTSTTTTTNEDECLWIWRRNTCQIVWNHAVTITASANNTLDVVNDDDDKTSGNSEGRKNNRDSIVIGSTDKLTRVLLQENLRAVVRRDIQSVIDEYLTIEATESRRNEEPEQEEREDYRRHRRQHHHHAWTFVAWCITTLTDLDDYNATVDDDDDDDRYNDTPSTIFTPSVRKSVAWYLSRSTYDTS